VENRKDNDLEMIIVINDAITLEDYFEYRRIASFLDDPAGFRKASQSIHGLS